MDGSWDGAQQAPLLGVEQGNGAGGASGPAALLLATINNADFYNGHAARRAALKITSRIPDASLAADLTEELFLAIEAVQIEVELGGGDSPLLESWRADAMRVLKRIEAAGRQ
ncbi:MAG TPA: hypothetical protein VGN97_19305 [Mesorhizobium sp.]|nr:hypothetical protein [Mesorhizobium sp.]